MAQVPTQEQIDEAVVATAEAIVEKQITQQELGKEFLIDEDGHAAGVVPEEVWQAIKEQV